MTDSIVDKFVDYHKGNPQVYEMFKKFTQQVLDKGRDRISAKFIFERMRWESLIVADDPEEFKINNNYTSFYARMFEHEFPEHEGLFAKRKAAVDSA